MLRLGITGGIGSGKTTVCKIFESLGVPVYYADIRAKEIVAQNLQLRQELIQTFGEDAFINGEYNRAYIASVVFADKAKLEILNNIIHPHVLNDWEQYCQQYQHLPYIIKEAAIMLETDSKQTIDKVALVYAPKDIRLERVMKRDGVDAATIKARMVMQMPEEEKLQLADVVIYNDMQHSLIEQVLALHKQLTLADSNTF